MLDGLINIIKKFNQNDIVIFGLSLITVFSFIMTLNVWLRTKTIKKELYKIKIGENWDDNKADYVNKLEGYKETILNDKFISKKSVDDIQTNLEEIKLYYSKEKFNFRERMVLNSAINNLNKVKPDFDKAVRHLRYVTVRLRRID